MSTNPANPDNCIVIFDRNDVEPRLEEPCPEQGRFNIAGYLDSLVRSIGVDIRIPQDSEALWRRIFRLRIRCKYSPTDTSLLHSVNGFDRLMGALSRYFNVRGIRDSDGIEEREQTLQLCREIVKLVEILGFGPDRPCHSETLCGIMRMVYLEGRDRGDKGRIVSILHSMLYDVGMRFFEDYYNFIKQHLEDPISQSSELSLCADVTSRLLVRDYDDPTCTSYPLSKALCTIVPRIFGVIRFSDRLNEEFVEFYEVSRISDGLNEEFDEECAVLEKVMRLLCRLWVKYGLPVMLLSRHDFGVMGQLTKILRHALFHRPPDAQTFNGRLLLYALLMAKYIYESPAGNSIAEPEDVKVVLDFSMSDLPNRYLFNGRRRLKDLVDQMVPSVLNSFAADYVLKNWNTIP